MAILDLKRDGKIVYDSDFFDGWHLKRGMKEDQHYKVVDREVWEILLTQYGGRSVPRISVAVQTEDPLRPDYIVEVQHRQFEIINFPKVKYFQELMELEARVSRADTVKEARAKIADSQNYARRSQKKERNVELQQLCRLWKFEGQDSITDCKQAIEMIKGDMSKLPLQVHARIL